MIKKINNIIFDCCCSTNKYVNKYKKQNIIKKYLKKKN